jgi:phage-related protein
MPTNVLYVDDVDLSTLGLHVQEARGWTDRAATTLPTAAVIDAHKLLVTGRYQMQPRRMTLDCVIRASSVTTLRTNLDELRYRLRPGARLVRLLDQNDREATGYVEAFVERIPAPAQFITRHKRLSLSVIFPDPRRYQLSANAEGFSGSATDMPMGTAPVWPSISIAGAATDPLLTYKHDDGTTLATMDFTITLGGGATLVIDMDAKTIIENPGGINRMSNLTAGDFFALDPNDGDFVTSDWPTLQVDSGSGTANYNRAWW